SEACSPPNVVLGDLVELRQVEGKHLRPAGRLSPRTVQPRRDVTGVDDVEPGSLSRDAYEPFERVSGRAVDVACFGLEMFDSKLKIREPAENPRPRPVHRAGRVAQ